MTTIAGCRVDINLSDHSGLVDRWPLRYTFSFMSCVFEADVSLALPCNLHLTIRCTSEALSTYHTLSSLSVLELVAVDHPSPLLVTQSICAPDLLSAGVNVCVDVSNLVSNERIHFDLVMRARHDVENRPKKAYLPLGRPMQTDDRVRHLFFPTCNHRNNQRHNFVLMLPRTQSPPSMAPQSVFCHECVTITNERLKSILQRMPEPKRHSRLPATSGATHDRPRPKHQPRELKFATVSGELIVALVDYLYFGHFPEFCPSAGFDLCAMYACARYLELVDLERYCLAELVGVDTQRGGPLTDRDHVPTTAASRSDEIYESLDYRSSLADPEYLIQELFSWAANYDSPCHAICRALAMHYSTECSPNSELMIVHQCHPQYCAVLVFLAQERTRLVLRK